MAYKCYCNSNSCNDDTCPSNYGCFVLNTISKDGVPKILSGCLNKPQDINSICNNTMNTKICCQQDLCNISDNFNNEMYHLIIKIFVPLVMLILVICLALIYKYHRSISKYLKIYSAINTNVNHIRSDINNPEAYVKNYVDDNDLSNCNNSGSRFIDTYSGLLPLNDSQYQVDAVRPCESCTSGSGSGMPFLVQRTIARQVQLIDGIGKGRFGEVWRGEYYGESVAVKIFSSRDETSWARETHIYNTFLLRHANILGYYASDMVSRYGCTQLWLITHYHALGSLYDHLHNTTFTFPHSLVLIHSIVSGLAHLHTEIVTGPHGKPRISHRDLKSKNILMINNNTACIADLGLSVLQSSVNCACPLPSYNKHKVGTKRYMSPEILAECLCPDADDTMNDITSASVAIYRSDCPVTFDQFISSDIYSLALVMWEVISRTDVYEDHHIPDYKIPFHDYLPLDPSTQEMKQIVCIDKIRPCLPKNEIMYYKTLISLVQECWSEKSQSRPTALRIKKNLKSLLCEKY